MTQEHDGADAELGQHEGHGDASARTAREEVVDELEQAALKADPERRRRREDRTGEAADALTPSRSAQDDAQGDT
ncbi:hypothetical protein [Streptomyces umbrinus]|uniref:hypothetical protein n=1 Tax=Streptomyces umbrinus TaxID=67370 RepID=UPI00344656D0